MWKRDGVHSAKQKMRETHNSETAFRYHPHPLYHKMQREKLYKLDKITYFKAALFIFKMNKVLDIAEIVRIEFSFS